MGVLGYISAIYYIQFLVFFILAPTVARFDVKLMLELTVIEAVVFWFLMWRKKLFSKAFGRSFFVINAFFKKSYSEQVLLILVSIIILFLSLFINVIVAEILLPSLALY